MKKVIETPCFPNKWKVVDCIWPTGNETYRYYACYKAALAEAKRQNKEPK